ncbi:Inner membrane ABC transporter permease protein YnjC [Tritonibacter multivorans]|uniref:Inner membrane ABC transporter permease protein YnjC n=1 Tax=Tritonibacter multivorans TaxID=928856 RepID=A0A0P1G003_9RHOB|nr:Inner membrane ABC transporter permease protein YnjC [Tritonibacter multivorans]SFD44830.1 putative thiamine transport system permease protein [Tritonibacter multivorans]
MPETDHPRMGRPTKGPAFFPTLTLLFLLGPVLAGLLGTLLPSFGLLRPSGAAAFSLEPWTALAEWPGLARSLWLSLKTGVIATLIAFVLAVLLVAGWQGTRWFKVAHGLLSPLLSLPHTAAALGLAFLIAPSGWVARLMSPWATGWNRPPDILVLNDPGGWSLIFGLVLKELPFLLLMLIATLPQLQVRDRTNVATALGYGAVLGWCLTVLPGAYRQTRLPVYAVLAYAISNVDMALILGPTAPPVLSIQILNAMNDPDLGLRAPAAAAALLQLVLVLVALIIWKAGEVAGATCVQALLWRGARGNSLAFRALKPIGLSTVTATAVLLFSGLLAHFLWSVTGRWRFPDVLPQSFKTRTWDRAGEDLLFTGFTTVSLAFLVAVVALALVIGCLETEHRRGRAMGTGGVLILYIPLILPQISFLPGLQILLLLAGVNHGIWPVAVAHLVFVLPYVFLTLAGPFRAWDRRLATVASALGHSQQSILWRVKLPMMLAPILIAIAIGMAVSVGQYLPTLLASGGRVETLTTEAIALASGGNRREIGVWAITLTFAAWIPFLFAYALPALMFRNRKGMTNG